MITLPNFLARPSAEAIAQRDLEEARRKLLKAHEQIEAGYVHIQTWAATAAAMQARIERLREFMQGGKP